MDKLLTYLRDFAYSEVERTGMPIKLHVDLATAKGISLAKKLGARQEIVEAGTLMMDCVLGEAIKQNNVKDHVDMCFLKTEEILQEYDVPLADKQNILHCVKEHHGSDNFYSIESEICCNADCYRFVSIKGFVVSIRFLQDMQFEEMVTLVTNKVDEKWNALSLEICKEELQEEHELILNVLKNLKRSEI